MGLEALTHVPLGARSWCSESCPSTPSRRCSPLPATSTFSTLAPCCCRCHTRSQVTLSPPKLPQPPPTPSLLPHCEPGVALAYTHAAFVNTPSADLADVYGKLLSTDGTATVSRLPLRFACVAPDNDCCRHLTCRTPSPRCCCSMRMPGNRTLSSQETASSASLCGRTWRAWPWPETVLKPRGRGGSCQR